MGEEGHVGLSNEKAKEAANGEFFGALSYLKADQTRAYFVIHVYSNTFDYSPYLQRSNVRGRTERPNFLERLGFTFSDSCNILRDGRCYYQVVEEVDRDGFLRDVVATPTSSKHDSRDVRQIHGEYQAAI